MVVLFATYVIAPTERGMKIHHVSGQGGVHDVSRSDGQSGMMSVCGSQGASQQPEAVALAGCYSTPLFLILYFGLPY